jgi:N-acetylneuraminate synthase
MLEMKDRYQLPVGFSDHTIGIAVPITAVALGACLVEKHFTLSKWMYGPDAKNSADLEDFRMLVDGIRTSEVALTHKVNKDQKALSLKNMKITFEKSIVAASDLPSGTLIEMKHLAFKKPGNGIPARLYHQVVGKTLTTSVTKNHMFKESDFKLVSSLNM